MDVRKIANALTEHCGNWQRQNTSCTTVSLYIYI